MPAGRDSGAQLCADRLNPEGRVEIGAIEEPPIRRTLDSKGGLSMKLWIEEGRDRREEGKIGWVMLWLLGIPIPILLILFLLRGCT